MLIFKKQILGIRNECEYTKIYGFFSNVNIKKKTQLRLFLYLANKVTENPGKMIDKGCKILVNVG